MPVELIQGHSNLNASMKHQRMQMDAERLLCDPATHDPRPTIRQHHSPPRVSYNALDSPEAAGITGPICVICKPKVFVSARLSQRPDQVLFGMCEIDSEIDSGTGRTELGPWARNAARRMEAAGLHFGHGTSTAFDEACWMLSAVLDMAPDFDVGELMREASRDQLASLEALLARRVEERKPLAYLLGEAWFAGMRFQVDESTLIPRSPLAEIARGGLLPWLDFDRPLEVLDVGTGSGCIAIALAAHWPKLRIDAVDISNAALPVAASNIERHGVSERVRLLNSDLYEALGKRRYDLIISNPPYVPAASMRALPYEYRHEPELALVAGEDGLDIFRELLAGAPEHLTPGGFLLVELGEASQAAETLLGPAEAIWLEFEHGGDGVVMLDRAACLQWRS